MPDYKESQVSGTKWQRCHKITISNPYGAMPSIRFDEESRISFDGTTVTQPAGGIIKDFDDPATTFLLRNPETGEPVGATASYGEVYALLWSLYMALAEERDSGNAI